jgi:LmbE family N-acetylglucosaminyl deacetylase
MSGGAREPGRPRAGAAYLSPHFDDAALSCGGAIRRRVRSGESVRVITVCAGRPAPGDPLSPLARSLHESWGNPGDVVATRGAENRAALGLLGAQDLCLDFPDCIYRRAPDRGAWLYNGRAEFRGALHPVACARIGALAEAVESLLPADPDAVIFAPMGVGHHVDHQWVREAAWLIFRRGRKVAFYEDLPYADPAWPRADPSPSAARETLPSAAFAPRLEFFPEEDLRVKLESIRAYASQMPRLFGGDDGMERHIRGYALRIGEGRPAERIWEPLSSGPR